MICKGTNAEILFQGVARENICVVADFDRTITIDSQPSWGIISRSILVNEKEKKVLQDLYDIYYKIEVDQSLDFNFRLESMRQWYQMCVESLIRCNISEIDMTSFLLESKEMQFKKGAKEFLQLMNQFKIPVIIISAGIGNFIKTFLERNSSLYDNIHICSNMFRFDNGILSGIDGEMIHSLNKEEVYMPEHIKIELERRKKILLLGDLIGDTRMVDESKRKDTIRVLFLNNQTIGELNKYMQHFDIACIEEIGYDGLNKLLSKKIV